MSKLRKGFTLIELLVVIAIIGILSSVVLASLNTARSRGNNAKIKSQLSGLRAAAELWYDSVGSYNGSAGNVSGACGTANSMFADANVAAYLNGMPSGVTNTCYSSGAAYAVSTSLSSNEGSNTHWCVDSSGNSKPRTAVISGATCN